MATISLLADLSTFPITRQELKDMWDTATVANIDDDDLSSELLSITTATTFSDFPDSPDPGKPVYHLVDNILYVWHDVVNGTGVSQWLAIGPDIVEVPCIAAAPIPSGAAVDILYDRWVFASTDPHQCPLGYNQSGIDNRQNMNADSPGDTAASGVWCRIAIEGFVVGLLDNALSNASPPAVVWDQGEPLCMDPAKPWSLVTGHSKAFPVLNIVGGSILKSPQFVGTTSPTEPAHYTMFNFQPRVYRPFGASTPE